MEGRHGLICDRCGEPARWSYGDRGRGLSAGQHGDACHAHKPSPGAFDYCTRINRREFLDLKFVVRDLDPHDPRDHEGNAIRRAGQRLLESLEELVDELED
jgi:hypothetical protein